MLSIKNNVMARNASRHLGKSYNNLSVSVARLSSGLRINGARDDAAGLAVRELIRADVARLEQGSRNAQDAISMLQTAEGAMGVMDDILIRMEELAEQAATDSYSLDQRGIMQQEFSQLIMEIDRIAGDTKFNNIALLDNTDDLFIQVGSADTSDSIYLQGGQMNAEGLGIGGTAGTVTSMHNFALGTDSIGTVTAGNIVYDFDGAETLTVVLGAGDTSLSELVTEINKVSRADFEYDAASLVKDADTGALTLKVQAKTAAVGDATVTATAGGADILVAADYVLQNGAGTDSQINNVDNAKLALTAVADAIKTKDQYRAKLGYWMNRLEGAADVADIASENLSAAESRISDVDVASEMATMTRNQVLAQAGISMLAQANQMPQMALKLLA